MVITLTTNFANVLEEVEQKSAYVGAKMVNDETAFERIGTIDEDQSELMQYINECRSELTSAMEQYLVSEGTRTGDTMVYDITLDVRDDIKPAMVPSMEIDLFNFFVYGIITRWYMVTNKEESPAYAQRSADMLASLKRRMYRKLFRRGQHPF